MFNIISQYINRLEIGDKVTSLFINTLESPIMADPQKDRRNGKKGPQSGCESNKNNGLLIKYPVLQKYNSPLPDGKSPQSIGFIDDCRGESGNILVFKRVLPVEKWVLIGVYWSKPGANPQAGANRVCTETGTPCNGTGFPVLWDYDCLPDRPGRPQSSRLSISRGWRDGVGDPLFLGRGTPNYSIFPYLSPAHFQITIGGRNID
jgi:hypothetical protein